MKIKLSAKCSDLLSLKLIDDEGRTLAEHEGYVPVLGFGGGDYIKLVIDNETGKIEGWKPHTVAKILDAMDNT